MRREASPASRSGSARAISGMCLCSQATSTTPPMRRSAAAKPVSSPTGKHASIGRFEARGEGRERFVRTHALDVGEYDFAVLRFEIRARRTARSARQCRLRSGVGEVARQSAGALPSLRRAANSDRSLRPRRRRPQSSVGFSPWRINMILRGGAGAGALPARRSRESARDLLRRRRACAQTQRASRRPPGRSVRGRAPSDADSRAERQDRSGRAC